MAGFFNTSWDIGNMFSSPYSNTGFYNQDEDSSIVPRPGSEGPEAMTTPIWGAPTGYDSSNMFAMNNNPYQTGANSFYNPYSFGQTTYGTQYGGGQQPWWMNYNQNNSVVNPPNIPTTSIEPEPQAQAPIRPQGTGPDGKDLTYAETIKYFGLYDGAENAFAAGDKQAAYRQDHMQWRSGTGAWEGNGKQEGQSDLDYPGRTTDAGDVIMGDRKKLLGLSGMFKNIPDNLKALLSGNGAKNSNNNLDFNASIDNMDLTFQPNLNLNSSLDPNNQDNNYPYMRNYDVNTFLAMEEAGTLPSNITRVIDGDVDPFNQESNYNYTTPSPYTPRFPSPFNQNSNYEYFQDLGGNEPLIMSQSMTAEEQARNGTNRSLFGIGKENFVPETRYGVNNSRELIESNLSGVNKPTAVEDAYNQRRLLLMRQESEKQAAMAESKRAAEEYEAQNRAEAAAKAAAEKARQATAAQKRMNDRYETGPVTPNIFTTPKATTGYTTKDVNNSFAARRNIRNIFA